MSIARRIGDGHLRARFPQRSSPLLSRHNGGALYLLTRDFNGTVYKTAPAENSTYSTIKVRTDTEIFFESSFVSKSESFSFRLSGIGTYGFYTLSLYCN
jgi:hypothetical protein